MGFFITFEGIEGCGKTTQVQLLRKCLEDRGHRVVTTREPGGTPIGETIRSILLDPRNREISLKTELLLYQAARAQLTRDVLAPSLEKGYVVLCDRFTDATLAYQGCAQQMSSSSIRNLNRFSTDDLIPDLTILIDCPVETGLKRVHQRTTTGAVGIARDRFEEKNPAFHQAVRFGYLAIAEEDSDRFLLVDGREDVATVEQAIQSAVLGKLSGGNR